MKWTQKGKGKGKGKRGKGEVKERRGEGKGRKAKEMKGKDTKRKEQERTGKGRAGKGEVKQRKHNSQCGSALSFVPSIIFLTLLGGGIHYPHREATGNGKASLGHQKGNQKEPQGTPIAIIRKSNGFNRKSLGTNRKSIAMNGHRKESTGNQKAGWLAPSILNAHPSYSPRERKNHLVPSIFWWPRSPKSLPMKNLVPSTPP